MTLVFKVKLLVNLLEDTHAIMENSDRGGRRSSLHIEANCRTTGMVYGVIEHLCECVVPNTQDVLRHLPQEGRNVFSPNSILRWSVLECIPSPPLNKRLKAI